MMTVISRIFYFQQKSIIWGMKSRDMGRELNSLASGMLKGIEKLIDVYGDSLNDDIFKEKLGSVSAKEIMKYKGTVHMHIVFLLYLHKY